MYKKVFKKFKSFQKVAQKNTIPRKIVRFLNDKENKKYLDEHDRRKGIMIINQIIKKESAFVIIFQFLKFNNKADVPVPLYFFFIFQEYSF